MERIAELRIKLTDGTITTAELAELNTLIVDATRAITDSEAYATDGPTDEDVATLTDLADAKAATMTEITTRETAAAARREAAADLAGRILAGPDDEDGDDADTDGDAPADVIETTPIETVEPERELVAASAKPTAVVSNVRARGLPERAKPKPLVTAPKMSLVASANVPGFTSGTKLDDPDQFTRAFASALSAAAGHRGESVRMPVASSSVEYSDDDTLGGDLRSNLRKIKARTSLDSIVASGGACAPSQVLYDLPVLGTAARPVRDQMLVRFGADRGGVRIMPSPKIGDLDAAVNVWSAATDAVPGANTKQCLTVTCPSPAETLVDAIVRCLKFGNFQARFFSEQTDAWMTLAAAQWAREAEVKSLTSIGAGSTNVVVGQGLGTTRDVLAALDRASAGIRSANRLPHNFPLRFAFPTWLYDNMRTDLARELPGATAERLATADAELDAMFRVRNVIPTSFLDGETGQVFAVQGAGALIGWPTNVICYLYPEGSWLFLDGGTLDLGIVRDSTLNAKNDFQMFAESFEQTVFHGVVSYRLNIDICPSGNTSAAVSFNPCVTGS